MSVVFEPRSFGGVRMPFRSPFYTPTAFLDSRDSCSLGRETVRSLGFLIRGTGFQGLSHYAIHVLGRGSISVVASCTQAVYPTWWHPTTGNFVEHYYHALKASPALDADREFDLLPRRKDRRRTRFAPNGFDLPIPFGGTPFPCYRT